jgi:hypothetical protein
MYKFIVTITLALAFFSCRKEGREAPVHIERTYSLESFTRIQAGDYFQLHIKQGAAFNIKGRGNTPDLDDLLITTDQEGNLTIRYNTFKRDRYQVNIDITLPVLTRINLGGECRTTIKGFRQQAEALRTVVSGNAKCTVEELPDLVKVEGSGVGEVTLSGTTPDLIANLSGEARLNAYSAAITDADVYTSGKARAYVAVQKHLSAVASGDSRIFYKGDPAAGIYREESGTARVIKE